MQTCTRLEVSVKEITIDYIPIPDGVRRMASPDNRTITVNSGLAEMLL